MATYRKPYRLKRKKSILKNRFFWYGVLLLIAAGGFFYLIYFASFFQVKSVNILGNEKISSEDINNIVQDKINNKILFLKSRSIFLVNSGDIEKSILDKFPPIAKIQVKKSFPDKINIGISERIGQVSWCRAEACFLLDNEGVIFEDNLDISPGVFRIYSSSTQSFDFKLGDKVIDKELLSKIIYIESKLKGNLKIPLLEVSVISDERFNAKTFENWEIYFNPKTDIDWQLEKLGAVLEKQIPLEKRDRLEYIELRFGNLASYKYR